MFFRTATLGRAAATLRRIPYSTMSKTFTPAARVAHFEKDGMSRHSLFKSCVGAISSHECFHSSLVYLHPFGRWNQSNQPRPRLHEVSTNDTFAMVAVTTRARADWHVILALVHLRLSKRLPRKLSTLSSPINTGRWYSLFEKREGCLSYVVL